MRGVRGRCGLLRRIFDSVQRVNHLVLVIVVLKVEVEWSIRQLVFYYLMDFIFSAFSIENEIEKVSLGKQFAAQK